MKASVTALDNFIMEYKMKFGEAIKNIWEKGVYTQEQLAELMNIHYSTISKIENGKFGITVDYLVRFSIFLDNEFKVVEK